METPAAAMASSASLPLKTRITLTLISTVTDAAQRTDGTVNRRLLNLLSFRRPPNPNPINGVKTSDVTVDPSRNLWFRLFEPTTISGDVEKEVPVIVFFHGGGFSYLSPDVLNYDHVCRRFARNVSAIVVSVNYRLTPEHRYPAQYDDGFDVLRFLDDQGSDVLPGNADLGRCFLVGDSAGGNIAHHVAKRASEVSTFRHVKVMGLVAIQPFFGGEERTESEKRVMKSYLVTVKRTDWLWKAFLPREDEDRDHESINVSGPRAADISHLTKFPPTMVVVGGLDPLQDWQRRYYDWLKRSGKEAQLVEYPDMVHAFYLFPELSQSTHFISQVKHFVHSLSSSTHLPSP